MRPTEESPPKTVRIVSDCISPPKMSRTIPHGAKERVVGAVDQRQRGLPPQVAQHAVRAAKAGEHDRVHPLAREGAVAHAVQPLRDGRFSRRKILLCHVKDTPCPA